MQIDKAFHALMGILAMGAAAVLLWVHAHFGLGAALAFAATTIGIAVELYQKVRHEGEPDIKDALATALPGWLFWLVTSLPSVHLSLSNFSL